MRRVVTIDGPAGAGKSTVSRRLADRLGWRLLDTGAMYRAVTYAALRTGVDLTSDDALGTLAARSSVQLPPGRVLLDGEDVTAVVRSVEITQATRFVADSPSVRRRLVAWQREFAGDYDVITEGRDQGTVVFPNASRKFFLTATLEERVRRRHAEYEAKGEAIELAALIRDLRERDSRDAERAIAPMIPAPGARVIDTTGRDLDELVVELEEDIRVVGLRRLFEGTGEVSQERATSATGKRAEAPPEFDRSLTARLWYRVVQTVTSTLLFSMGGIRASGREHLPRSGGALLISNHMSHLDVFILGIPLSRPLNYVARLTLFFPPLGTLIRSVGAFPIQRDGMGAQGLKETLRRIRQGGIVVLFPEGTRSRDGELGEMKAGIGVLATRAKVPVVPTAIAGTFEAWPRSRPFPLPHPVRIQYGRPISPEEMSGLDSGAIAALLRERILECQRLARNDLRRDLDEIAVGENRQLD